MPLVEVLVTAYGFVIGACIGSFLNVVAWRLPLGMSLIRPASHCPSCKTPIRMRDNVPVLGWILLRGRCRSCGCKISARYPLVEFAVGAAFALLVWRELATGGSNLPPRAEAWAPMATGLPFDSVLLILWLYHVTLVSILAVIALVELDKSRLTRGFLIFAFCAGLLPPLIWPELRVTFAVRMNKSAWTSESTVQQALQYLMFGIVLGTCLAWSFDPRRSERGRIIPLAAAIGAVGLFLGDAAVSLVACIVSLMLVVERIRLASGLTKLERLPGSALVWLVTIATIVCWPTLRGVNRPIESGARGTQLAVVLGACLLMAVMFAIPKGLAFNSGAPANEESEDIPVSQRRPRNM